jgi:protease-4
MKAMPNLFSKLFCSQLMLHQPTRTSFELALLERMGFTSDRLQQISSRGAIPDLRGAVGDGGRPIEEWIRFSQDLRATQEQLRIDEVYCKLGNVAVVKVHGVIDKMLSQFEMDCYGGCDLADVDKALALAANDPQVDTVVLWIESPGGSVTGTPETAARIAQLRQSKEVHVYSSTMLCSAAYYIASQADWIATSGSAIVGSIGVYMAILDQTRALEMEGYSVELIKAGKMKAMGASFKKLTADERSFLQAGVDEVWAQFKAACTGLRDISEETMQGQWFDGRTARTLNVTDETTALSIDEYVAQLLLK